VHDWGGWGWSLGASPYLLVGVYVYISPPYYLHKRCLDASHSIARPPGPGRKSPRNTEKTPLSIHDFELSTWEVTKSSGA
jgi:hypothetical protein